MNKKTILLGLLSSLSLNCFSQKKVTKSDHNNKNLVTTYLNTITEKELKDHLYIIASDEMQGRNTGEEGQKKTGKYIISEYIKNNISFPDETTSYYQPIPSSYFQKAFSPRLGDSENIWTFIKGTEKPKEIIIVSAHYDHVGMKNGEIYNGADDDGSGTVSLLEIAEAFQKAKNEGHGPKRSILFLHVTGEEHGLHGSRFYSENPLFPLKNTIANVNIDMIGRRDDLHKDSNNYLYIIGSDYLSSDLYTIVENANSDFVNLKLDYKYNDKNDPNRFYYRSDHYNFAKHNIPSVFLFNGTHEDYHKPTDDPDKIEYDALAKRAKLAFAIIWNLANRNEKPVVDKL
ncbi:MULTISPECIES: M28 family peptidase [Flavobacterium]|uniref:M28 family peptidase n=1 Tax=Flavobacterium columnare TaxID=996 RepID=UPI0013E34B3D|nr:MULTISPECIES: M28 family peptidase [Flavobacterium]MCH4830560.1 M28 family peptidase [Flavobacterium columnare]MCH4833503.1 M28 family peptidase [Flavobacterium columnare]QYS91125.1 M28 family peptidase [Flavobacterium covae]